MPKKEALLYEEAVNEYFGGLTKLSKSSLPFKCRCEENVMSVPEIWSHIREKHRERIVKKRRIKKQK